MIEATLNLAEPVFGTPPLAAPTLADRVTRAIGSHPHLARHEFQCHAEDGRVVLRGTVGTFFQKQMAQEAARRVDGVTRIINQLEVHWSPKRAHEPMELA